MLALMTLISRGTFDVPKALKKHPGSASHLLPCFFVGAQSPKLRSSNLANSHCGISLQERTAEQSNITRNNTPYEQQNLKHHQVR